MTRDRLLIGTFLAAFATGVAPATAQNGKAGSSTREASPSAERTGGSAVPRDSGGSTASSAPSSSGSSSSESPSTSSPSARPSSIDAPSRSGGEYFVAPSRPSERQHARQRGEGDSRQPSGGSSGSGARAVPRGSSDSAPSGSTSRGSAASNGSDESPSRRAVPAYSRPRDGRTQTGTAVDREYPGIGNGGGGYYPTYGYGSAYYRSPYRLYYVPGGYGFGLGYFYDPFWYDPNAYDPLGYGYGYGGGYGGGAGGGYYGGSGQGTYAKGPTGSLRLKIKPREAQVYVDGYLVGDVDSFDGLFQRLTIDAGGHRVEVRADGYENINFDVLVTAGETVTYQGDLKRK